MASKHLNRAAPERDLSGADRQGISRKRLGGKGERAKEKPVNIANCERCGPIRRRSSHDLMPRLPPQFIILIIDPLGLTLCSALSAAAACQYREMGTSAVERSDMVPPNAMDVCLFVAFLSSPPAQGLAIYRDTLPMPIVDAQGHQLPTPHAATVQRVHAVRVDAADGRPVAEDDAQSGVTPPRHAKPGQ